jgi:hypothetical protein
MIICPNDDISNILFGKKLQYLTVSIPTQLATYTAKSIPAAKVR